MFYHLVTNKRGLGDLPSFASSTVTIKMRRTEAISPTIREGPIAIWSDVIDWRTVCNLNKHQREEKVMGRSSDV